MKQRTITSVAIISVALLLVLLSDFIVYPIGLALLAVIAVFEMLRVMQADRFLLLSIPAYLLAATFPMLAYFFADEYTFGLFVACRFDLRLSYVALRSQHILEGQNFLCPHIRGVRIGALRYDILYLYVAYAIYEARDRRIFRGVCVRHLLGKRYLRICHRLAYGQA